MGTWSTGLYGSDFAADLQTTIKAVARLPFDSSRLVDILRGTVGTTADDTSDEDYTSFWLVVADQFHKRGIDSPVVFDTARRLIDAGADLEMARSLGMSDSDIRKRSKVLAALREKIATPPPQKKRSTLSKPEPFSMEPGDLFIYPVSKSGEPCNPYMPLDDDDWKMANWGAALALRVGRAFGFIAWYQIIKLTEPQPIKPTPTAETLTHPNLTWRIACPGSCPANRFKRIQFTKLANFQLNQRSVDTLLTESKLGADKIEDYAIEDVCISNALPVHGDTNQPSISGLGQLVR